VDEAVRRAGEGSGRPLFDGASDKLAAARALLARREPFYSRAHARVATEGRAPADIAGEILAKLSIGGDP